VRLGAVAATGGATRWVDLTAYDPNDTLVVRVGWSPDAKRLVYEVQNRVQSWLDLLAADPETGKPAKLFREETKYWVDPTGLPSWLADGSFLWQSDRTGWRHLYHYAADARLLGPVTSGEWDERDLIGATAGWVYFSAAEHSPIADHIYRVRLDGSGLERLTDAEGNHSAEFNPQFTQFVDEWSNATTPPQTRLRDASGRVVRTIEQNPVAALASYRLGTVEFLKVPAGDGFSMEAMMIKPPGFDPSKRYPVMAYTYAGPGAQSARDTWGRQTYMWHQMIAEHGYIIWICDNRQASAKGVRSQWTSFHNFGEPELQDLEDGVAWLRRQPYVDASRIGIWGWSFGGFMTTFALTHSESFKIGIAGAPVTDWRNYDSIYTERYMGLPGTNPDGYDRSSVVKAAAHLHGKLLLIHGATDDNVHMQNSVQLIDALEKAGKPFEFMLYPQSRHGVTNPLRVKHLRATMAEFIFSNL
jgi:dipeptidyl-peptidase-4